MKLEILTTMILLSPLQFTEKKLEGNITTQMVQGLDKLTVDTGGQALVLSDMAKQAHTKTVKTCAEYNEAKGLGFKAYAPVDIATESFFSATCGTAKILAHSNASKQTNFKDKILDPETLPGQLLQEISEEGPNPLCVSPASFNACKTEHKASVSTEGNGITYRDDVYAARFTPILRADINGDGWEDAVVNLFYTRVDGSGSTSFSQICLQWRDKETAASVVSCPSN